MKEDDEGGNLVTVQKFAEQYRVDASVVRGWIKMGYIEWVLVGPRKMRRIRKSEVLRPIVPSDPIIPTSIHAPGEIGAVLIPDRAYVESANAVLDLFMAKDQQLGSEDDDERQGGPDQGPDGRQEEGAGTNQERPRLPAEIPGGTRGNRGTSSGSRPPQKRR